MAHDIVDKKKYHAVQVRQALVIQSADARRGIARSVDETESSRRESQARASLHASLARLDHRVTAARPHRNCPRQRHTVYRASAFASLYRLRARHFPAAGQGSDGEQKQARVDRVHSRPHTSYRGTTDALVRPPGNGQPSLLSSKRNGEGSNGQLTVYRPIPCV